MAEPTLASYGPVSSVAADLVQCESDAQAYRSWRQRFMGQRMQLGLSIAVVAYFSFMMLRVFQANLQPDRWDSTWMSMALTIELGLLLCLVMQRTAVGHRYPALIFLSASWSITLIEQVWATGRHVAFPGLFSWSLVFLTQATLIPVRWRLHLISQLGILGYYFGVNTLLGLQPEAVPLWDGRQTLYLFWFCCICNLAVYLYETLQRAEFLARRQLEAEQERSERLLLNILPEAIANQLKRDQRTIADSFAEATVLFADIVSFTQLSSGAPPRVVVSLLNQIFSTFDQLVEQHQLEKIKTIGDAYMVVGGLPVERADHIEAIANLALDMQLAMTQFRTPDNQPLQLRIGINTGPVIAGVIGRKKFIYDLWGDSVNVASRMESQGLAGCIQVTASVYEQLRDRYRFDPRGMIEVKGKGLMPTYLLRSPKPIASNSV